MSTQDHLATTVCVAPATAMGITPHWTLRSAVGGTASSHERARLGGHMLERVPAALAGAGTKHETSLLLHGCKSEEGADPELTDAQHLVLSARVLGWLGRPLSRGERASPLGRLRRPLRTTRGSPRRLTGRSRIPHSKAAVQGSTPKT
jgi:hypothetical protein